MGNDSKPPNRLREWRQARRRSLETVAADLRVGLSTLQRYETGERPLTVEVLEKIAVYYAVGPGDLLNRPAHAAAISQEHELLDLFRLLAASDQGRLLQIARIMGDVETPGSPRRRVTTTK